MSNKAKAYSENELLDKLKYYCPDFNVHLQDIRNPTPEFVREMYRRILIEFNIDISSLEQPHFSQMENLSPFAEMYHDSIPVINLMKAIRKLKIIDLGISDLTDPAPKRNLEQMSAMMRFVEFCDEKITEWNDKRNFVKSKRSRKKELLKNIDELKEERNRYTLSKENSIEEKLELEKVYQILTQEQASVLNEKDVILEKRNLLKTSINEKERQVEKLNQQLCEEEELIKSTREQIVASPLSIVNDLKNMRMKQLEYSEELQNLKDKLVSKKQINAQMFNVWLLWLEEKMEPLQELIFSIKNSQEKKKTLDQEHKILNELTKNLNDEKNNNKKLQKKLQELKEELSDLNIKFEAEQASLYADVELAQRNSSEVNAEIIKANKIKILLSEAKVKIKDLTSQHTVIEEKFSKKISSIVKKTLLKNEETAEALMKFCQVLEKLDS